MFISGTHKPEDIIDDLELPLNVLEQSNRYKTAKTMYEQNNPTFLYAHSLAGAILNHLNNNIPSMQKKQVTIYNSPLTPLDYEHKNVKDISSYTDVISAFNTHSKRLKGNVNLIKSHFSYK